jgi:hypothetical protein
LKLSLDENEIREAIEMRSFLSDKLLSTQNWAQEYALKFSQQKQETISTTSRRSSSNSNHIDTLVNLKARKAALGKRMQYSRLISEQERKLEQLKMQGEFEEVSAQESVYETLTETGNVFGTTSSPALPTEKHNIMSTFLEEATNIASIPTEQTVPEAKVEPEEPRSEHPSLEALIQSPYQSAEDRPDSLS